MRRLTTSVIWLFLTLSFVNAKANDVPRQNEDDTLRCGIYAALYYCQERQPKVARFNTVDPKADQYPGINPYLYCAGNPIKYVDPDGNEPVKNQVGTIEQFVSFFNNTRTKMGQLTHQNAENALLRLSKYKIGFPIPKISPKTTPPFNKCQYRYVYTKKAG